MEHLDDPFAGLKLHIDAARRNWLSFFISPTSPPFHLQFETLLHLAYDATLLLNTLSTGHPLIVYPSHPIDPTSELSIWDAVEDFEASRLEEFSLYDGTVLVFEGFPRRVWESTLEGWIDLLWLEPRSWGRNWWWRDESGTLVRLKDTFSEGLEEQEQDEVSLGLSSSRLYFCKLTQTASLHLLLLSGLSDLPTGLMPHHFYTCL